MRRGRRLHRRSVLPRQARLRPGAHEGAIRTDTPVTLYMRGPMIINLLATWIPALGIAFLGVLKLTGNPRVAEEMSKLGVGRYLRLLGVMEIAFAALFVVPATMKLGFILASCYFAGAIATELSHAERDRYRFASHARYVDAFIDEVVGTEPLTLVLHD